MKKTIPFFAVAFSGFLVYLFDKLWGKSLDWESIKKVQIGKLISTEFNLLQILIFLGLASLIYLGAKRLINQYESFYTRKQRKLRKYNRMEIPEADILFKWDVYFSTSGKPKITNLTGFCKKHEGAPPIQFINNRCPIHGCTNSKNPYDESLTKNAIESDVIHKWDIINK